MKCLTLTLSLRRQLAADLPPVRLDKNKLKQAFVNVLTNAVHAMPDGGTVIVRTYARELAIGEIDHDAGSRHANRFRPGETVVIAEMRIQDTASRPDNKLGKVLTRSSPPSRPEKERGLGLTVTKKIV